MLDKKIQDALNEQIKDEYYASYLYLSMSAWCAAQNLSGFAHWMRLQSQEELAHALKLLDYMCNRGAHVVLHAIDKPPSDFKSMLDMFEQSLRHEQKVTEKINELYELALREKEHATEIELQWFIREQVEEEKTATDIVERLKLVQQDGTALLLLDNQLGARTLAE
ncbi:MAG: ferritin [Acidobacteriota bacterium]